MIKKKHNKNFRGFESIVSTLLNAGADPNITDVYNNTSLHYASMSGH